MIIADRMKKNPATATPDMSISDATAKMKAEKVHRLPVLDDEKHPSTPLWRSDTAWSTVSSSC